MADDKKDDYEFTAPDFDEASFIHKEMVSFRTTAILFVWGIIAAAVSWGLYFVQPAMGWVLGLGVCALFGVALKVLFPRLGADIAHFKRREWTGVGFLFFFTWLSFFLVAVNPPVTDIAAPHVFLDAMPAQQAGGNVVVEMLATDNAHLVAQELRVERIGTGTTNATVEDLGNGHMRATLLAAAPGTYRAVATARDDRNPHSQENVTFVVGNVLRVNLPSSGSLDLTNTVVVHVDGQVPCSDADVAAATTCIRSVALRHTDGSGEVLLAFDDDVDAWGATSTYKGWKAGNNTVQAVAQFQQRFLGAQRIDGGEIVGATVTVNVPEPTGTHEVVLKPQPAHRAVKVPGPELGLLAVGVLALAFVARRKA